MILQKQSVSLALLTHRISERVLRGKSLERTARPLKREVREREFANPSLP